MSTYKIGVVIGVGSPIHPDAPLLGYLLTADGDQLLTFGRVEDAKAYWDERHKSSSLAPSLQFHTPCNRCGNELFIPVDKIGPGYPSFPCPKCRAYHF